MGASKFGQNSKQIIPEMTECSSVHLVIVMVLTVIDLWATSLMLVSAQCKTAGHGPYLFQWRGEHSLVKVAKLQCKIAGHGPCLLCWGLGTQSG